jgi:hypothetical protein
MRTPGQTTAPPSPDAHTTTTIADLAARAYADERDRLKALDTKAGLLLSANSAVIGLVLTVAVRPPDPVLHHPTASLALARWPAGARVLLGWCCNHAAVLYFAPLVAGLACLLLAELRFVQAVRITEVASLNVDYWVDRGTLARDPTPVRAELGAAYIRTVHDNQAVGRAKAALLDHASRLLLAGILAVTLVPVLVAALTSVLQ